jgi:hypothetical protein
MANEADGSTNAAASSAASATLNAGAAAATASPKASPNAARRPLPAEPEREVTLVRRADVGFGLSICGGEQVRESPGRLLPIVISKLRPGGPAAESKILRVGDRIVAINNEDISCATHNRAVSLLRFSPDTIKLVVRGTHVDWSQAGDAPGYAPQRQEGAMRLLLPSAFERVRILYNFPSRKVDELDLQKGDIVHVMGRGQDGWCIGECQRTKKKGFFPGNFAMKLRLRQESVYADVDNVDNKNSGGGSSAMARSPVPRARVHEVLYEELPDQEKEELGSSQQAGDEDDAETADGPLYAVARPMSQRRKELVPASTPQARQQTDAEPVYEASPHVVSEGNGKTVFSDGDVYAEVRRPSRADLGVKAGAHDQTSNSYDQVADPSPYGQVVSPYGEVVYATANSDGDYEAMDDALYSQIERRGAPIANEEDMYAKLPGDEGEEEDDETDSIYSKLPSEDGRPPVIPERK